MWRSNEMVITLKNAAYGYETSQARSVGGRDGIYLLDRDYRPENPMMRKLFDRYLDKSKSGAEELAEHLETPLEDRYCGEVLTS